MLRDESQKEHRYSLVEEEDSGLRLNQSLSRRFGEKELGNWVSSMTDRLKGCGVSYEEIKGNMYDPLPPVHQSIMSTKIKKGFSGLEKLEDRGSSMINHLQTN